MILERLKLAGFEGYKHVEVEFSPGLNLITGRNSTGKTTLLDAVLFALYGEVPGVEKRMLVSRLATANNRLSVGLSVKLPNGRFEVWRTGVLYRKGGKENFRTEKTLLFVNEKAVPLAGEEDLRRKISKLLGIGLKKFINLIYVRQGELTSILKPRKEDMDFILDINVLREVAEQLDEVRRILEKYEGRDVKTLVVTYREHELPRIEGYITSLNRQIAILEKEVTRLQEVLEKARSDDLKKLLLLIEKRDSYTTEISESRNRLQGILDGSNASNLQELRSLLDKAERDVETCSKNVMELDKRKRKVQDLFDAENRRLNEAEANLKTASASTMEELETLLGETKDLLGKLQSEVVDTEEEYADVLEARSSLAGKISSLRDEVKNHKRLLEEGVAECPTCGQKISPDLLREISFEKEAQIRRLETEYSKVDAKHKALDSKLKKLRGELEKAATRASTLAQVHDKVKMLLRGETLNGLREKCRLLKREVDELTSKITEEKARLARLEANRDSLKKAFVDATSIQKSIEKLEENLRKTVKEVSTSLKTLCLPFDAEDPDLKSRVAERIPLSREEIETKEAELQERKQRLKDLKSELKNNLKEKRKIEEKLSILEERLRKAEVTRGFIEKLREGIEKRRRRLLRNIQRQALSVYNTLTDQHVYKAFQIDPETYEVYVQPVGLAGFIPASRVGGGHQTLIALSIRMAILNVLGYRSLLILDEPTYGVDSQNLPQLMNYITEMAKNLRQVLLVTHYGIGMEEATNIIKVDIASDGSSQAKTLV